MSADELPAEAPGENAPICIVRYPNRRFYDRSQGRYVTLPEIGAMIRAGKTVTVREARTNEDRTSLILTQILLDQFPERIEFIPVPILHLMIRANALVLGLLREYLRQGLFSLEQWQRLATANPFAAPMEWLKGFLPSQPEQQEPPPAPPAEPAPDVEALARRIVELERRLDAFRNVSAPNDLPGANGPDAEAPVS